MDAQILAASQKYPKPTQFLFEYGTAGFRMNAGLLDSVVFRTGLLAALRSRKLGGQTIGVMITASHNPADDNGIKLVDPRGEMLERSWETYATELANAADEELVNCYNNIQETLKINPSTRARVIYARDTRMSGIRLVRILAEGLKAAGVEYTDYKLLITPQLHYMTRCINTEGTEQSYGEPSEKGYYEKLSRAFAIAIKDRKINGSLVVDCANGIGGPKLAEMVKYIQKTPAKLEIIITNDNVVKPEILNFECGADFVKSRQRPPRYPNIEDRQRCCSFDGDADRIIYYFLDPEKGFRLMDGDKIATLCASFFCEILKNARLDHELQIGVVQTAYANGASTKYLEKGLGLPVVCTPTGVKWLHHAATKFDIGIYFEANGHGTVVFSQQALKSFNTLEPQSPAHASALAILKASSEFINQTVGDAISDMLLVETILAYRAWTIKEWDVTYADLPNRLVRVEVSDRNKFQTTDAERRLISPYGLQDDIDALVKKYTNGRAFARASGTENIVRVYAEAATRSEADDLASKVALLCRM
ncbi:Phosphoacetylglucosamine mutase [Golovinomyces cichoracearum]|uniref:Phosphoacetylglucosamine mutase n=1 Tax=Golovinomyces cichoracearum TaxID=62708 RepID=A0A420INN5_9PEZI|nr:Phosphoacetylglucosamine mutase [Golovinomyces cichoracearum]